MRRASLSKWTLKDYERAADVYLASLPLEHFMEATDTACQRKISWVSLDLIAVKRRAMQVFNELLVQYDRGGELGQVVPDNAVRRSKKKLLTAGSYNIAFEGVPLFWVLEYVSRKSERKDYVDNFHKYEQELKVPYYLTFCPESKDLRLHRHNRIAYRLVKPNAQGRLAVPELEIEVAVLDGWVRFWYQGELIPLPEDLQAEVEELRDQLDRARTEAVDARRRANRLQQRAVEEKQRANEEKQRADEEKLRADEQKQRADEQKQRADEEKRLRLETVAELQRLRAQLAPTQAQQGSLPQPRNGK